jgi:pimeloyl-ACP methyl ester carboxylesterase
VLSALAGARRDRIPADFVDYIRRSWPSGTWPQMLTLYRSGDPDRLAAAGARLGELRCPALVVWGRDDPYLPARFGRAYAERLPNAELVELDRAGHWPWLERPEVVDRTLAFLAG